MKEKNNTELEKRLWKMNIAEFSLTYDLIHIFRNEFTERLKIKQSSFQSTINELKYEYTNLNFIQRYLKKKKYDKDIQYFQNLIDELDRSYNEVVMTLWTMDAYIESIEKQKDNDASRQDELMEYITETLSVLRMLEHQVGYRPEVESVMSKLSGVLRHYRDSE